MPDSKFDLGDYVQVKDRIAALFELFGQARIETAYELTTEPDDKPKVICRAMVYRTPDDDRPATGTSWMYLPGTTSFTKGSELENAETSAVGRAIGFLGILIDKSIASANEVAAKRSERNPRVGADDYEPLEGPVRDGIIGVAKKGTKNTSDAELRQTPDGYVLGFRLEAREGDRGGILVEAHDDIASALSAIKETWLDKTVTCWGSIEAREFKPARSQRVVKYSVLMLSRIQTSEWILPAPGSDPSSEPSDEPDLTLTRQAGSVATPEPPNPSGDTPVAADVLGAKVATGLPSSESDAEELVKPCGAVGSGLGTLCSLPTGHSGKHRELATDGRTLAAW